MKDGSIGIPFPETDAADRRHGRPVEVPRRSERSGELAVKGPQVMLGYWNRKDETDSVLRDGWLLTGDIARMDEDGLLLHRRQEEGHDQTWAGSRCSRGRSKRCCSLIRT